MINFARTWQQRMRTAKRLASAVLDRRLYPSSIPIRAYWWTGHANFGDDLTRLLLPTWRVAPLLKPARSAEFFGVGSIIELIPEDFTGVVWGSGKMYEDVVSRLPRARVLAVRGAFTRDLLGLPQCTPIGDPGLLVSRVFPRPNARRRGVAVVPHFTHQRLPEIEGVMRSLGSDAYLVDVTAPAKQVIRRIASADLVVTTSLHGLVIADAYGIPALWALPEPTLAGGGFKFRDHESVVLTDAAPRRVALSEIRGVGTVRARAVRADPRAVTAAQDGLIGALSSLTRTSARRISPLFLAREQRRA